MTREKVLPGTVIGDRIRILRECCGWTQQELAEYLGYDQSHIAKLENGKRNMTTVVLDKLCDLYNIDEHDLVFNPDWEPSYQGIQMFCKVNPLMKKVDPNNSKTIHITLETYRWLKEFQSTFEKDNGEELTFDDIISYLFVTWMDTHEKHNGGIK